jgi:hypothetical protein
MSGSVRKKAEAFCRQYGVDKLTLEELRRIITSQGYTIVEFNHIFNDEPVTRLIEALKLDEMVEKARGFTYADRQRRLVFVHEDLTADEKLLVLAHEEGHIYCDHFSAAPVIGRDVVEEHEANEFTHYILNRGLAGKFSWGIKKHRKALCIIAVALAVLVAVAAVVGKVRQEQSYHGHYYITASGDKYHKEDCRFIKDKNNVHRMTVEEYESGEYEPCGVCMPQEKECEDENA